MISEEEFKEESNILSASIHESVSVIVRCEENGRRC